MVRRCLLVVFSVISIAATARAEVSVEYRAAGGINVDIVLEATTGGQVEIPSGTIIATGLEEEQRFLIGQTIERTLRAGERATVSVQAFCLDLERSAPSAGSAMHRVGVATGDLQRLLAVAVQADHGVLQQAIWALGSRSAAPSSEAVALLRQAGLAPKDQVPETSE